jgi:CubicO group peptidase (beta-lactamase class C family)
MPSSTPSVRSLAVVVSVLLVAQVCLPAAVAQQSSPPSIADDPQLEAFIDGAMESGLRAHDVPGATVAVVADGEAVLTKGYGYADVERERPVVADETLFRVGSVSKLVTWTAVRQGIEEGRLDPDADVNRYLDEVTVPDAYPGRPVTLERLATHTAGFEESAVGLYARSPEAAPPTSTALAETMPDRVFPPGEVLAYSNYGAGLAGYVAAESANATFENYTERRVFDPLGMDDSTFRQRLSPERREALATSYSYADGRYVPGEFQTVSLPAAGAMSTTATDMSRFMLAYLGEGEYDGGRILEPDSVDEMFRTRFEGAPAHDGVAFGFFEFDRNGVLARGHGGAITNYRSVLMLFPGRDAGIFVSYNGASGIEAWEDLYDAFVERYFPDEPPTPAAAVSSERDLDAYTGTYRTTRTGYTDFQALIGFGNDYVVTEAGNGTLRVQATQTGTVTRWDRVAPGVFERRDRPERLVFGFDESDRDRATAVYLPHTSQLERLAWYETSAFHQTLFAVGGLVLLSTLLWPWRAFRRRVGWSDARGTETDAPRWTRWLAGASAFASLGFLVSLLVLLGDPDQIVYGLTPTARAILAVPPLLAALGLATTGAAVLASRRGWWTRRGRLHYALVALALLTLLWQLAHWHLLGVPF